MSEDVNSMVFEDKVGSRRVSRGSWESAMYGPVWLMHCGYVWTHIESGVCMSCGGWRYFFGLNLGALYERVLLLLPDMFAMVITIEDSHATRRARSWKRNDKVRAK